MQTKILGRAAVITSSLKTEMIKKLARHNPEALNLRDENKEQFFTVRMTSKSASIGNAGIAFADTTADGSASLTVFLPEDLPMEERETWFKEHYSTPLFRLAEAEHTIGIRYQNLSSQFASIESSISCE